MSAAMDYRRQMMALVRAGRRYAKAHCDLSRGWTAIADLWDDDGIWDLIVYKGATTEAAAIAALAEAAATLDK